MTAWLIIGTLAAVSAIISVGAVYQVVVLQRRVKDIEEVVGLLAEQPGPPMTPYSNESWRDQVL